ncbi:MAG: hypothetical protein JWQ29_3189 [Phenylobacterium sp.]|nr:hypothetical protein [Phenylobacterium sp.]
MQTAISNQGAAILSGAALAAVAGLMLGGAMRPQLAFDGRPMGPQMFANGGGPRSTGPFDPGGSYAAYGAELPTYVIGTDYAQQAYVGAPPIAEERRQIARNDVEPPEPAPLARPAYDEPPLPEIVYPSIAGGRSYGEDAPAAPPPPDDAAPTITG